MTRSAGISVINPATAEEIGYYEYTSPTQLDAVLDLSARASADWAISTVDERVAGIAKLADSLRAERDDLAALVTAEMGKPLAQAYAEIDKCIFACQYYRDLLPQALATESVDLGGDIGRIRLVPLGTILSILPWNYPWWQVVRAMLPAIAVGNTVILKHADSVTGSAFAIERLFRNSFGHAVLSTVVADADTTSKLIDDERIAAVTFTGSDRVGALVAARAGASLKKCVLELGGSDPFVVLADADVDKVAAAAVKSRFLNNGESCIAAKRILVHQSIKAEFVDALVPHVRALTVGDPLEPTTDVGPLARFDLLQTLQDQKSRAMQEGGSVLAEACVPSGQGAWFAPAIVEVADRSSILMTDETFGPLGALTTGDDDNELVAIANNSRYGLSCSVWSGDIERAERLSQRIVAGSVFINTISATDPRLPTGGVKASGYGRELSHWGIAELANVQSVRIKSD